MLVSSVSGVTQPKHIAFTSKKNTYVNYQYYKNNAEDNKTDSYKKSHKKLKTAIIATASTLAGIVGIGLLAHKLGLLGKK